jgi:N-acetylneuraminate synthase
MFQQSSKPFFVFEMANNHMGDVQHGIRIIQEINAVCAPFRSVFDFGFKLQYRNLETLIHPDYTNRTDFKYVKRFNETKLSEADFLKLKACMSEHHFVTVCTPFDEISVENIERHGFEILKVASCSFSDWPLLERIGRSKLPVIASTAGVRLEEIDNVVSFFEHRKKPLGLMHCVAEYPTAEKDLQMNQIDLLRNRYSQLRIGFSTHEYPDKVDPVKIAMGKGATLFEKHVGVATDKYKLNEYSATPAQVQAWLTAARSALEICGGTDGRSKFTEKEISGLHSLRRGLFAKRDIKPGEQVLVADVFMAMPTLPEQFTANDFSKYAELFATEPIKANQPVNRGNTRYHDHRNRIYEIIQQVKGLLKDSHAILPHRIDFEISHHYGIAKFQEFGATIINCVNREYCKKLIAVLAGQQHPEQYHKKKEETFQILYGDLDLYLNGEKRTLVAGDIVTVGREVRHRFTSQRGAVLEEISSTHFTDDSYYTDPAIATNKNRKSVVTYWMD